jgi:rhomboid protease GluP
VSQSLPTPAADPVPPAQEFTPPHGRLLGILGLAVLGPVFLTTLVGLFRGGHPAALGVVPFIALALLGFLLFRCYRRLVRPVRVVVRDGWLSAAGAETTELRTPAQNVAGLVSSGGVVWLQLHDPAQVEPHEAREAVRERRTRRQIDLTLPGLTIEQADALRTTLGLPPLPAESSAGRFEAFHRNLYARTPYVPVTAALVALNVAAFLVLIVAGADLLNPTAAALLDWGANFGPLTVGAGQWWRLLACTFLHFGFLHLFFNMWVLADVGRYAERLFGHAGFALLYLASGLLGSAASLFWHPAGVSAGASGAVFGVIGGLIGFMLVRRRALPPEVFRALRRSGGSFLLYNLGFAFVVPGLDQAAHLGGCGAGVVFGAILARPWDDPAGRGRGWRLLAAAVLAVAAVGAAVVGLARTQAGANELFRAMFDFEEQEPVLLDRYNAAVTKARDARGEAALADVLERDILPAWKALRARIEQAPAAGGSVSPAYRTALVNYLAARQEGWELLARAIREGDRELADRADAKQREAARLATDLARQAPR